MPRRASATPRPCAGPASTWTTFARRTIACSANRRSACPSSASSAGTFLNEIRHRLVGSLTRLCRRATGQQGGQPLDRKGGSGDNTSSRGASGSACKQAAGRSGLKPDRCKARTPAGYDDGIERIPGSVTVAQEILVLFVQVRILAG